MSQKVDRLKAFVEYVGLLSGDEKGEAQVFCDRLFQGFGHAGYKEAGATLEFRVRRATGTGFADLVWPGRLLLEMKKRGEKLELHYQQAFDYWVRAVPNRPRFVVLCNFDTCWIYDFDRQIDEPVDIVHVVDFPTRYLALNFLFPEAPEPVFGNDRVGVTRETAGKVAEVFGSLVKRGGDRVKAQRFILQSVVAMFAEDMDLLPKGTIYRIVEDCKSGASSYDLFGGLFRQMNSRAPAPEGRYKGIPYFNGGLFEVVEPAQLSQRELGYLGEAAAEDWAKVNPAIFGTLFQRSMDADARHAQGAHYTSEADVLRVVQPTIVRPWQERIAAANTMKELMAIRTQMLTYRVLDPACGSGNFLYVAYRELAKLELQALLKMRSLVSPKEFTRQVKTLSLVSPRQFHGVDVDGFGLELAKVTLMLAKKLALDEAVQVLEREQVDLDLHEDHALPLDNLDANFIQGDALFLSWPVADAIIGNPPFQSKNKMQAEFGKAYVNRVRKLYPEIPGRADYCVYWLRRAHDELGPGMRAGLVGTNTIRQNYSREGGLDYIVSTGGTITEAVATQVWSGEAVVHVSIVNWVKGVQPGKKRLFRQIGDRRDSPWEMAEVDEINASLSFGVDTTGVGTVAVSAKAGGCYQGQTHGHKGFLLSRAEADVERAANANASEVLFPYMTADDLLGEPDSRPTRCVIDFGNSDLLECGKFPRLLRRIEESVLPTRQEAAQRESARNEEALADDAEGRTNKDHEAALGRWWQLFRRRAEMLAAIRAIDRYIVCGRVTRRPIFEFVCASVNPNDALMVFPYRDDYSFGILQSGVHWAWFTDRCSTMKADWRYTSNSVFDTFPWPQMPSPKAVADVIAAAVEVRTKRRMLMKKHKLSLRELYRAMDKPGKHDLGAAHAALDAAVYRAYGWGKKVNILGALVELNQVLIAREQKGQAVRGPGWPLAANALKGSVTKDCIGG